MAEHDLRGRQACNDMTHCALAIEQLRQHPPLHITSVPPEHHLPICPSLALEANDDWCYSALRLIVANDDWGRSSGAAAGGCGAPARARNDSKKLSRPKQRKQQKVRWTVGVFINSREVGPVCCIFSVKNFLFNRVSIS